MDNRDQQIEELKGELATASFLISYLLDRIGVSNLDSIVQQLSIAESKRAL